ncbi:MAG TPA: hypothetical protein VJT74_09690 [Pyrinomonadaceae bacterium]|nr:hypothetical protein [Pyrinomonadaceae bacterium]
MQSKTLSRGYLLTACVVALLCLSQSAQAQSGRRQKTVLSPSPPADTTTVTKDKEGEAKPRADKPAPLATVIVGGDRFSNSYSVGPTYIDEAVESCTENLNRAGGLEARGGGDMTRKDAVDRAKKETEAYVLWLEMRVEGNRTDDITVTYTLFRPQTAKIMAYGNVYLATRRVGKGPVGVGVPGIGGRMPLQYLMREAGREVAGRVADKLHTVTRD